MLNGKHVLLIVGGGIAAFKCHDLIRELRANGARVTPVLTSAAREFVTPMSLSILAASKVYCDLFDVNDEIQMGHIELSRMADVVVVAPATADLIAKISGGLANDLASTLLLATDKPVLVAPAMNVKMWENPSTQRNIKNLNADGIDLIGPNEGTMACGEFGFGRMAEPTEILAAIRDKLSIGRLAGKHVLVTSGSTQEPLDPVRYISNYSSGKQGSAIAKALVCQGAKVTFISGPSSEEMPKGVLVIRIRTADEMFEAVKKSLPADIAIMAAAVSDWKPINISERKVKKHESYLSELKYNQNIDILKYVSTLAQGRPGLVIGFAAETENLLENGSEKLSNKGCDWILANDVSPDMKVFGGEENAITFISRNKSSKWARMTKELAAQKIVKLLIKELC